MEAYKSQILVMPTIFGVMLFLNIKNGEGTVEKEWAICVKRSENKAFKMTSIPNYSTLSCV